VKIDSILGIRIDHVGINVVILDVTLTCVKTDAILGIRIDYVGINVVILDVTII
jgi:hypothetical protein